MKENTEIMLTPEEAQKLNNEGWVLKRLGEKLDKTSPRKYFVIGKW